MRICIATPDIIGPIRNGGIGTAYAALADVLANAGHKVTILYLLGDYSEIRSIEYWVHYYAEKNIAFVPFFHQDTYIIENPGQSKKSYEIYQWLLTQENEFDIIHFPEWLGYGYYSILSKREGLAFQNTTFIVTTHSPYLWHKIGNQDILDSIEDLEIDFIERESVRFADYVISPSKYMLEWLTDQGWILPEKVILQPNILPNELRREYYFKHEQKINEIVFFGRLEIRKGLELFCSAVDFLVEEFRNKQIKVTFLGKIGVVNYIKSDNYILQRTSSWGIPVSIFSNKDRNESIEYLSEEGRIAIISSLCENSPYTVLECLGARIPFLASSVGGIPELIHEKDRANVCYSPTARELKQKLVLILEKGIDIPSPSFVFAENAMSWLQLHNSLVPPTSNKTQSPAINLPLVSVCITHFNRHTFLSQMLESIYTQDYPRFEVILVDDGSNQPDALNYLKGLESEFEKRQWKLIYQDNLYLGAARNTAASYAQGEYLLFMDDDNFAKPNMISTFIRVARGIDADILTCAVDFFSGKGIPNANTKIIRRLVPLGGSVTVGVFRNCFGDANSLIRKEVFQDLGGFTEEYGIGNEDWEFFAHAVLDKHTLYPITDSLFWYRRQIDGMSSTTNKNANYLRSIRSYLDLVPPDLKNLILYLQGQYVATFNKRNYQGSYFNQIDLYWNSTSWKITRPFRNLVRFLQGKPREQRPEPQTEQEAENIIREIQQSFSWEMTGPLRAIVRLFKRHSSHT